MAKSTSIHEMGPGVRKAHYLKIHEKRDLRKGCGETRLGVGFKDVLFRIGREINRFRCRYKNSTIYMRSLIERCINVYIYI